MYSRLNCEGLSFDGTLDPSPVFDMTVGLDGIPDGYNAMDERKALKVLIKI